MKVGILGAGHVGLVTGVALASLGHEVVGADLDEAKIASLREGVPPFHEPELPELLGAELAAGRIRFTSDVTEAVRDSDVVFICVGRPPTHAGDRSLTAVEAVGRDVARTARDGVVVAEKSTVPPGTADRLRTTIERERPGLGFSVVANPEFLREGHAIEDTLRPARIVVGADDEAGRAALREVYRPLTDRGHLLIETDVRSAELAKLASNAFLATKISFANSLARLSELAGADVDHVTRVMGADPRIGPGFLQAGLGYGGYCLPKDVIALQGVSERLGFEFGLLRETTRANEYAVEHVAKKVEDAMWNLEGKRIGLLGLAFKAGTDDVRSAPSLGLARRFLSEGAQVVAHDPMAADAARSEVSELEIATDPYAAATDAHCLVVCTEWDEYRALDLERLRDLMAYPVLIDGRNLLDGDRLRAAGFTYHAAGRAGEGRGPGPVG